MLLLNSGSDFTAEKTLGPNSFGSSSKRFKQFEHELKVKKQLPGPAKYYQFGAGNFNPGSRGTNNSPFNPERTLDEQWINRSPSSKYGKNGQMSLIKNGSFGDAMAKSMGKSFMPAMLSPTANTTRYPVASTMLSSK